MDHDHDNDNDNDNDHEQYLNRKELHIIIKKPEKKSLLLFRKIKKPERRKNINLSTDFRRCLLVH